MLTPIQEVRISVGDVDPTLPILDDSTYDYFLTKNTLSVRRAAVDAARTILLHLATRGEETIDIFTVKGGKAAEQYRLALQLFLRDPSMNPVLTSATAYAGGISLADMLTNNNTADNNYVNTPLMEDAVNTTDPFAV